MRKLVMLVMLPGLMTLALLCGCERVKAGRAVTKAPPPLPERIKEVPEVKPPTITEPTAPTTEELLPETPTVKAPPTTAPPPTTPEPLVTTVEPTPPTKPTLAPTKPTPPPTKPAPPSVPLAVAATLRLSDEAQSLRASVETLRVQFEQLTTDEARTRLTMLNQTLSELEVRLPALVLWRTALRLETLSKATLPDVGTAKQWLMRAKELLSGHDAGLKAIVEAEKALTANKWTNAVAKLRENADRLNASAQAEALMHARTSFLNALDALARNKRSVAKAELGEALKALDKLLSEMP